MCSTSPIFEDFSDRHLILGQDESSLKRGAPSTITGVSAYYGGGGGGGTSDIGGVGAGGVGGGGGYGPAGYPGSAGAGGSGVVIIAEPLSAAPATTTCSPTVTTVGNTRVYQFSTRCSITF